jgi:hypothetical protein
MDNDHDPIEDDPKFKAVIESVMSEVMAELKDHPNNGKLGFCHTIWAIKRRILKEKHGIKWRTPKEMNPMNFYD